MHWESLIGDGGTMILKHAKNGRPAVTRAIWSVRPSVAAAGRGGPTQHAYLHVAPDIKQAKNSYHRRRWTSCWCTLQR
ncbi:hypothetical protein B0T17DRAFT_176543 [Bombardia bombarda]|uniref:Uncharacterized protein n=1 Tax=Bombardia bombarda TaxID=252184 RepID=A0AA39X866_9PEZI|nr:hypothetical protein B0T17DRAFT_176543 [Bombardia bombarda]